MLSICFEIKTTCKHCGDPLPLNALTNTYRCEKCGKDNEISDDTWKSLLEDNAKEVKGFTKGEGQNSTVFTGEYQFALMYGRQDPRCGKCKTDIPETELNKFTTSAGDYKCQCGNSIYIRTADKLLTSIIGESVFIVGEDPNQLQTNKNDTPVPSSTKPVIFTCPACAGSLKVDGTKRLVSCTFCNSDIYLPDDLWFMLHPAKTIKRWYVTMDSKKVQEKLPEWYYLSDITSDSNGNIYVASAVDGDEDFIIWSFTPELKTRWIRKDLQLVQDYNYENTKLSFTPGNKLMVSNSGLDHIIVLSPKNGSDIKKIPLGTKGCFAIAGDKDGTILALMNNKVARLKEDGSYIPAWGEMEEDGRVKKGFFEKLFSSDDENKPPPEDPEWAPYANEIGNSPKRVNSEYTNVAISPDGHIYFLDRSSSDGVLVKYTREGKQLWKKVIPLKDKDCKPAFDPDGNIYLIGLKQDNNTNIIKFSPQGEHTTIATDILEGGTLEEEDMLAVVPDGKIYAFKYNNRLKVFNSDMSVKYVSEQSQKDDQEAIKKKGKH